MNPEGKVYNAMGRINRLSVLVVSAYDIALKHGFEGTEEEWLASLKATVSDEQVAKAVESYFEKNPIDTESKATVCWVELLADKWVEDGENEYSQVVKIHGLPEKFDLTGYQVDLTPSREVLAELYYKDAMMVAENENGVVTVCLWGQKLTNDYAVQVTITEVVR